jgi:hypothetical protein
MSSSATSGKDPLHKRLTKTASGTHGSFEAHPPGIMCGGSACAVALALADAPGLELVDAFVVVPALPGSVAGFSLDPHAKQTTNAAVTLRMATNSSSERSRAQDLVGFELADVLARKDEEGLAVFFE